MAEGRRTRPRPVMMLRPTVLVMETTTASILLRLASTMMAAPVLMLKVIVVAGFVVAVFVVWMDCWMIVWVARGLF